MHGGSEWGNVATRLVRMEGAWHVPRMRAVLALLLVLGAPVAANAHVIVLPGRSEAGGWERYTMLVPTEKSSPTVRVELSLPNGVEVVAVESKPGWQGRYEPFPIGAARVEWKGGRIPEGEFVSFEFLAWNPPVVRVLEWHATQWYEDGTSERWGEGPDEHHTSRTTLTPSTGEHGGLHRHGAPAGKTAGPTAPAAKH
jgi:uncharacterized protein YcnI